MWRLYLFLELQRMRSSSWTLPSETKRPTTTPPTWSGLCRSFCACVSVPRSQKSPKTGVTKVAAWPIGSKVLLQLKQAPISNSTIFWIFWDLIRRSGCSDCPSPAPKAFHQEWLVAQLVGASGAQAGHQEYSIASSPSVAGRAKKNLHIPSPPRGLKNTLSEWPNYKLVEIAEYQSPLWVSRTRRKFKEKCSTHGNLVKYMWNKP